MKDFSITTGNIYDCMMQTEKLRKQFKEEVQAQFPDHEIVMNPLSLCIACHIGPGALAITCTKKLEL